MRWTEAFAQLGNTQVESRFADHRTYLYEGKEVDQQTHLGFDLASTAQAPVTAANRGVVVHAAYLGIYGNCVIVDHGLGVQSLYAHLSSLDVKEGDTVDKGQTLGRSGTTGLAGGDHLHFTMLVGGVQVNPVEWWDGHWMEDRVFRKIREAGGTAARARAEVMTDAPLFRRARAASPCSPGCSPARRHGRRLRRRQRRPQRRARRPRRSIPPRPASSPAPCGSTARRRGADDPHGRRPHVREARARRAAAHRDAMSWATAARWPTCSSTSRPASRAAASPCPRRPWCSTSSSAGTRRASWACAWASPSRCSTPTRCCTTCAPRPR